MCIRSAGRKTAIRRADGVRIPAPSNSEIFVGEEYNVVDVNERNGDTFYRLSEKEYRMNYKAEWFMPLSEIDETEFERNFNKELV